MLMMSPYDRERGSNPWGVGAIVLLSLLLHLAALALGLWILPQLFLPDHIDLRNVMVVQLAGGMPLPPDTQKGPARQGETPSAPEPTPPPETAAPEPPRPTPAVPDQTDVIPLKPREEKKPELAKDQTEPPQVKPEKKPEPEKPQSKPAPPQPKPRPSADDQIQKRLQELEKSVAAKSGDEQINDAVNELAQRYGQGGAGGAEPDTAGPGVAGALLDPERQRYYQTIYEVVSRNWNPPVGDVAANAMTVYYLRIEPDGSISRSTLRESSGNQEFDLSVERAIQKSNGQLPPLPPAFGGRPDNPALRFSLSIMRANN